MAEILTSITSVVTSAIGWVTSFVTLITDTPLLLLFVVVVFVGLGVGLLKRIISV